MQTLVFLPLRGALVHIGETVFIGVYFYPLSLLLCYLLVHLHTSHRLTNFCVSWLKSRYSAKSTSFLGANRKINIFTIFCKNTRNSLFPRCRISVSNNSGSIKDRAVQFAYSRGFRKWRIEWFDRHLCHVTGSEHAHRFGVQRHLDRV